MLVGIASNEIRIIGRINIKANINGNKTVQQNVINWSYLIRGKLARVHIKVKTNIQVLIPKDIAYNPPSNKGLFNCAIKPWKGYK